MVQPTETAVLDGAPLDGDARVVEPHAAPRRKGSGLPATRALLSSVVARGEVPGGIAAVGNGADPARVEAMGTIAFDDGRPIDQDTLWRIYSMTKPVTGMATMLLVHEGVIGLDQPLADFFPAFSEMKVLVEPQASLATRPTSRLITIRHLLTHTAGFGYAIITTGPLLGEYRRLGITPSRRSRADSQAPGAVPTAPGLREFCERLATLPLIAEPGTRWSYSIAQDVLGGVIEAVTGEPFEAFLHRRLFAPLGMASTGFQVPARDAARLATTYMTMDEVTTALDPGGTSVYLDRPAFPFGGTGLVSSARDFDRFLSMLLGGGWFDGQEIMPEPAVRLGMSNLLPDGADLSAFIWWPEPAMMGLGPSGKGSGFGAGGRVALEGYDKGSFSWSGAASTNMFVDPVRNLRGSAYINSMSATFTFAVLANRAMVRDGAM